MNMIHRTCVLILLTCALAAAQPTGNISNAITLAGAGYRVPLPLLDVAPGQVIVLHVNGIATRIDGNLQPVPGPTGFPHSLNGISADLVQGTQQTVTSLELHAAYQTRCAPAEACASVTGITLQVPFELETDFASKGDPLPIIRISENGKQVGGVLLRPVSDNVHVLNTCDDTQISISAAYTVPQNVCTPAVMVGNALNSLYNLAHAGDELAVWLFGMGAKTQQPPNCCISPDQLSRPVQQFQLNFDFRPNVPASPAAPGFGLTSAPAFAAYTGGGLYQVNFMVPPIPAGLPPCDGVKIKSNLTVTVTGANSFASAQLCVGM